MYKKYVKKRGKLLGPYYYESIREKSGKIRAFYLGKDPSSQKFKDKVALLKLKSAMKKGESVIIPVGMDVERPRRPFKINPSYLALKYFFGDKISKIKSNFSKLTPNLPKLPNFSFKIKLPKVALPEVKRPRKPLHSIARDFTALAEMFKGSDKIENLPESNVPTPGKEDIRLEALLFLFISAFYIFGFFYLEGTITTYAVVDNIASSGSYFPALITIVNFVLIVLIYLDLREVKK